MREIIEENLLMLKNLIERFSYNEKTGLWKFEGAATKAEIDALRVAKDVLNSYAMGHLISKKSKT